MHRDLCFRSAIAVLQNTICRKVWLIEGEYTSDTRYLEKLAEKKNQHHKLMDVLTLR